MSIALWQADSQSFLVLLPRGKLLQHMGMHLGLHCISGFHWPP